MATKSAAQINAAGIHLVCLFWAQSVPFAPMAVTADAERPLKKLIYLVSTLPGEIYLKHYLVWLFFPGKWLWMRPVKNKNIPTKHNTQHGFNVI
jgi:hypothetical protein